MVRIEGAELPCPRPRRKEKPDTGCCLPTPDKKDARGNVYLAGGERRHANAIEKIGGGEGG